MTGFRLVIFIVVALQAACVGHRTYTEQEKSSLAQTKTIWVDVHSDARTLPTEISGIVNKVEQDVKHKLTSAGFTVVPDKSEADAVLQLALEFSHQRPLHDLSGNDDDSYRRDAPSMRIDARLDHKEVGQVFWHRDSVSPPYDTNLTDSALIRSIDSDVLQALFKSTSPAAKKD